MLLWTWVYKYLFVALFWIHLVYYSKWNCWSFVNSHCSFLRNHHTFFHVSCTILHSHQFTRVPISLHPCQHLLSLVFHNILMSVQWYLISVLTGISLTTSDVEHSSCAYWPLVCLLWRHSYLSSLSIENSGWLFVVVAAEM